jgi:hypothetical protein
LGEGKVVIISTIGKSKEMKEEGEQSRKKDNLESTSAT